MSQNILNAILSDPELSVFHERCSEALNQFAEKDEEYPQGTLYHYTNYEALENIIKTHDIWMTDYRHLEDKSEIFYSWNKIKDELQQCIESYYFQGKNKHIYFWQIFLKELEEYIFLKSYFFSISFCSEPNYLPAWRWYADDARGFTVGFSRDFFIPKKDQGNSDPGLKYLSAKIHYEIEESKEMINELFKLVESVLNEENRRKKEDFVLIAAIVASHILPILAKIKHPAFSGEKEYRFHTSADSERRKKLGEQIFWTNSKTTDAPFVKTVPRMKISFKAEDLKEIGVGPRCNYDHAREDILRLLNNNGYDARTINIYKSDIPYKNE